METLLIPLMVALGVGGIAFTLVMLRYEKEHDQRLQVLMGTAPARQKKGLLQTFFDKTKEDRRRKLEQTLRKMQGDQRKKKRVTLRQRLQRAGLQTTERQFYLFSLSLGLVLGVVGLVLGSIMGGAQMAMIMGIAMALIGALGLPLWLLKFLTNRRMNKFLSLLPDAVELMVRGLRSGLPVTDAMRTIAEEIPDPVGPEFREIVEGQKIGIPIDQGLERLYERVPLPEVNFLSIALSIQKETGGNLSEALENLATVLRARKAMKLKVKAITQEAKVSAYIVGGLPVLLALGIFYLNPDHMETFYTTRIGMFAAIVAIAMMGTGIVIMRKMINFRF